MSKKSSDEITSKRSIEENSYVCSYKLLAKML